MRIILCLAGVVALAAVCAGAESRLNKRITVDYRNMPVALVLKDIGEKTGVRFSIADGILETASNVTYEAKHAEAGRVAMRILMPRGLRLENIAGDTASVVQRDPLDEFKVKSEQVFEFDQKPEVTRAGDSVTVRFATKGWCDVTVAIEDTNGRIIRHLASGVLGDNAPEPFQWNSKTQAIVWDGKNDKGEYVDDKEGAVVRVSLGLKSQFERTLFWSPHKRIGGAYPVVCPAPEGVYVAETYCLDHGTHGGTQLLLFDHEGNYVRTVYPFPARKIPEVRGLPMHTFATSGLAVPLKGGYYQATLLPIGSLQDDDGKGGYRVIAGGWADTSGSAYRGPALAVRDGAIALSYGNLVRLSSDGSSGGLNLAGPQTAIHVPAAGWLEKGEPVCPMSGALSPDRKWLYLTGYQFYGLNPGNRSWICGVARVPFDGVGALECFAGTLKPGESNGGTADGQFRVATSVACDAKGRVYVADYMNDRVQVFDADGKFLKAIPARKPASVAIHHRTGDIYVFSWLLVNRLITSGDVRVEPTFTRFGPFEDPKVKATGPLPLIAHSPGVAWNSLGGVQHRVGLDSWTDPPTFWIINGVSVVKTYRDDGSFMSSSGNWDASGFTLYRETEGKLTCVRRFSDDVKKAVVRLEAPELWRQRLYVNPANGKVYVGEADSGVGKSFNQLVELDADTGKVRLVDLPLGAEDIVFGLDGLLYIRTDRYVARYDPTTWREIPWDYGEELAKHSYGMGAKAADLVSALPTPGHRSNPFWHLGGVDISAKGHLLVTTCNLTGLSNQAKFQPGEARFNYDASPYTPLLYPGRLRWGELHIFDRHGKLIREDAAPGIGHLNGVGIDPDDNVYMLAASRRMIGGRNYEAGLQRDTTGTLVKIPAGKAKALSTGAGTPVPLTPETRPKRPIEIAGYTTGWIEGVEWFYGGVGFCTPGGCICVNCRFDLDYFSRSFAPEILTYTVAVLDSNGNLITRIGRYGNVQDGKPLVADGGPADTQSIGGDEVGLFHASYVASDTDRRLFIADQGNARILSVKLGYHTEARLPLKGVPDGTK